MRAIISAACDVPPSRARRHADEEVPDKMILEV